MKLVIDIPEEDYKRMIEQSMFGKADVWRKAIQNGTPLPGANAVDLISRQAVLDLAKSGRLVSNGNYKSVCDAINGLPSVEPERKTGLWMDPEQMICWCSICGCRAEEVSNYCPDCGAQMRPNWKKMEVDG